MPPCMRRAPTCRGEACTSTYSHGVGSESEHEESGSEEEQSGEEESGGEDAAHKEDGEHARVTADRSATL